MQFARDAGFFYALIDGIFIPVMPVFPRHEQNQAAAAAGGPAAATALQPQTGIYMTGNISIIGNGTSFSIIQ